MNKNSKTDVTRVEPLFESSLDILAKVLKGEVVDKSILRIATQTVGVYTRLKSADNAQKRLFYTIISDMSKDKDDLRKMIAANVPELKEAN